MEFNSQYFIVSFLIVVAPPVCQAKVTKKAEARLQNHLEELSPWQGKTFPYSPGEPGNIELLSNDVQDIDNEWTGKWFPQAPGQPHILSKQKISTAKDTWQGKWFPQAPGEAHVYRHDEPETICDNGVHQLSVDYDPEDKRHSYNYLCLHSNRSAFNPNLDTEALLTSHFLPSAYVPPSKCMNESIGYSHVPPTNGAFRPLPAVYGSYKYIPPQRYLRNLAEGAIVMLYHPCAFQGQVEQLQHIVQGCLYRYLISPSPALSPDRPLALLAWSYSLSMSVVDKRQVGEFIKKFAKSGPLAIPQLSRVVEKRESYKAALLTEAHLVTDLDDTELCGYMEALT